MPALPVKVPAVDTTLPKEKILAERFKTQMCRNYERKGACPYENKCMFAHGDADLRTPEMNVRDGLFTEEAIETYRRAQRLLRKRANQAARQAAAAERASAAAAASEVQATPVQTKVFDSECQRAGRPSFLSSATVAAVPVVTVTDDSSAMSTVGEVDSDVSDCGSACEIPNQPRHHSQAIPIAIAKSCEELPSPFGSSNGSHRSLGLGGGLSASNSISQNGPRLVYRHNPYGQAIQSPILMSHTY